MTIGCGRKKTPRARRFIEISGERSGSRFEAEIAAIRRALKGSPFIVAGGALRLARADFEWTIDRRVGGLTTHLKAATVEDIRNELRKRVRFSRSSTVSYLHLPELMDRARRAPFANCNFVWLRADSNGRIVSSSPPLHFGQKTKFGNG
ncbi:MAG: hypothetical protein ACREDT_14320 [Methylocella sp.]